MRKTLTVIISFILVFAVASVLTAQKQAESTAPPQSDESYQVIVQFNGGGENNKVYIGEKNTLEILIANEAVLQSMSIGFGFITDVEDFRIVEGYGDVHGTANGSKGILQDHIKAAKAFNMGGVLVNDTGLPHQVLIGGVSSPGPKFPASDEPRLVFSMQIEIPEDAKPSKNGFCVDNIFVPPGGTWEFSDGSEEHVPLYNGRENSSARQPSAPSACFELVKR